MSGGDVKLGSGMGSSGRFSLGGKIWRAPTPQAIAREERDLARAELERRKIKEVRNETRHLLEQRKLESQAMRANNRALGVELGSRGLGVGGQGLYRSRSVGHLGGGGLGRGLGVGGLGGVGGFPIGGGGMGMRGGRERLERERLDRERQQLELERVRDQRRRIEEEARRRTRTASMLRTERAQLAGLNNALLASPAGSFIGGSPRMGGSPLLGGSPFLGAGGLSPGYRGGAGLRRVRSFSSAPLGSMGMGHHRLHSPHASPRIMPVPVPMPMQQQRPVVNYNTYNVSPRGHSPHLHSHHGSPLVGGLGQFDDLNGMGVHSAGIIDPPLFGGGGGSFGHGGAMFPSSPGRMGMMGGHSPRMGGMMGGHSPHMGTIPGGFAGEGMGMGMGMGMGGGMGGGMEMDFVIEEGQVPLGRMVVHRIGPVVGRSAAAGLFGGGDDGDMVDLAVEDMTRNARLQGANGVIMFRLENDESGMPIALGEAVVLR